MAMRETEAPMVCESNRQTSTPSRCGKRASPRLHRGEYERAAHRAGKPGCWCPVCSFSRQRSTSSPCSKARTKPCSSCPRRTTRGSSSKRLRRKTDIGLMNLGCPFTVDHADGVFPLVRHDHRAGHEGFAVVREGHLIRIRQVFKINRNLQLGRLDNAFEAFPAPGPCQTQQSLRRGGVASCPRQISRAFVYPSGQTACGPAPVPVT